MAVIEPLLAKSFYLIDFFAKLRLPKKTKVRLAIYFSPRMDVLVVSQFF